MKTPIHHLLPLVAFCMFSCIGWGQNPDNSKDAPGKPAAGQQASDKSAEIKNAEWDNPKRITKHRLKIKNIEAVRQDGKKFLKLTMEIPDYQKDFVPYPLFRVVSAGKVIAERGLDTFALVYDELIPTDLEALPENFSCRVYIKVHGGEDSPIYILEYPAANGSEKPNP